MKISHNWLRQYINLEKTPAEVEEALTLVGFEVDERHVLGLPDLPEVVVGEVLQRDQHPDADRLGVCRVDVGASEPLQIVCGATNYKVGDRVPVALVGAVLPGDFKIKPSKLRGVDSCGMMCSAKELGLGEDHAGLLILSDRPELGLGINEVFTDSDVVYEVELTPNRPDCLSHIGIARELAAYWDLAFTAPAVSFDFAALAGGSSSGLLQGIAVEDAERCPLYTATVVTGVQVGPSPEWLQKALQAVGLRPINNVVDVTNYVLWETGHPLHAFDAKKIEGSSLQVRLAQAGEKITTLDEKERVLQEDDLVIADAAKPLVVAGVMGSVDAEVDASTVDIVLEAAYFEPRGIRRTARRLGLSTDSSYRFERGVDSHGVAAAARRALDLMVQCAGGTVVGPHFCEGSPTSLVEPIVLPPQFIRERCGFGPEDAEIQRILESLQLQVAETTDGEGAVQWTVTVPSYRQDLYRPSDLVEEFLRMYGTDRIPGAEVRFQYAPHEPSGVVNYLEQASQYLVGQHFQECINYTLLDEALLASVVSEEELSSLRVHNPLASDQGCLRPSLLVGLLENVQHNVANALPMQRAFEVGHVYRQVEGALVEGVAVAWAVVLEASTDEWKASQQVDFFMGKGWMESLLEKAGVSAAKAQWQALSESDFWQAGHAAESVQWKQGYQARTGLLDVAFLKEQGLDSFVLAGEAVFLPRLLNRSSKRVQFQHFSVQPATRRDLALLVPQAVSAGEVEKVLSRVAQKCVGSAFACEQVALFDCYEGEGLAEGEKSLAYALTFRAKDRTLKDKEVNKVFDDIQKKLESSGDYRIRK